MKLKRYLCILGILLYFELLYNAFIYDVFLIEAFVNIVLFDIILAFILNFITIVFTDKINKILDYIILSIMFLWYSANYIFFKSFSMPFSLNLFRQSDQVLEFSENILTAIINNILMVLLFLIPLVALIIFRKKRPICNFLKRDYAFYFAFFIIALIIYSGNIMVQGKKAGSPYDLIFETNNGSLNMQKLGLSCSTFLDIYRSIIGFDDKVVLVAEDEVIDEVVKEYDYNNLELDFNGNNETINNYLMNESGTKKNEYTGFFEGKNLIYIVAESFSELAVSEELTPTLYKLVNGGFNFTNYYSSNNLSTIGGEFQAITGLYADSAILSVWRGGSNYFPFGLATVFKQRGYDTFAYHNNSAYFQDRNVYLKTQGFDNFVGCYTGMEKLINCKQWPQSDIEMISATVDDYINSENLFLAYYMTVSGHFHYSFSENSIAKKNKALVNELDYSENVKGYLATQIELDRALELLINKLDEAGKLEDTVIVLMADHYPYDLSLNEINSLSDYKRDSMIEVNSNNLIIYNSTMEQTTVDKVGMSIDVLPTVYNLFGIDYDSRLIIGKDILSTCEGIAIFKDHSWVTNKGTYFASKGQFVPTVDDYTDDYVENINNIVNNRVTISKLIMTSNYYKSIVLPKEE